MRHYCGLICLPQVANAIYADEPRSGVQMGQAPRHHSTHQRGADEGRYNARAVLPQGAFDVQSIRASQTADPRAKQTHPSGPTRRSARVNSRLGDGYSHGSALSLGRSGGEVSEPAPFGWTSSACGCATAWVAAENLRRRWIGVDISPKAVELVNIRLQQSTGDLFHNRLVTARTDIPKRTDIDAPVPYRTV